MKITAEKALAFPVLLLVWLGGLGFEEAMPFVLVLTVLVLVRLAVVYRNVQTILIFYIFHLTFVLILIPYFFYGIPISPHVEFQINKYMNPTLLIHSAFVMALYIFTDLQTPRRKVVLAQYLPKRVSPPSYYLLVGIMIAIMVSMFWYKQYIYSDWSKVWETDIANTEGASGAPEYFCVVFLAAFVFASDRFKKYGLIGIFMLYSYLGISRGLRGSAILMSLLFFALFLDGKVKTRYILVLAILAAFVVHGVGALREGQARTGFVSLYGHGGGLLTNQGETFYTSNVIVSAIIDGAVGPKERLVSLFAGLLHTVFPPRIAFTIESRPQLYTGKLLPGRDEGGGCLASAFFYFWLDYLGVLLAALYIAWVTGRAIKHPAPLLSIYIVGVYSYYPRWLVYDAVSFLFRVPLYAIFLYMGAVELHKIVLESKLAREKPIPQ